MEGIHVVVVLDIFSTDCRLWLLCIFAVDVAVVEIPAQGKFVFKIGFNLGELGEVQENSLPLLGGFFVFFVFCCRLLLLLLSLVVLSFLALKSQILLEIFDLMYGLFPSFLFKFIDVVHDLDHPI